MSKRLFGLLILLIVIIAVAVLTLRLSQMNNGASAPSSTGQQKYSRGTVEIISETNKLKVSFSDKDFFMQRLDEINFWAPEGIFTFPKDATGASGGIPDLVTAKALAIHIVDKELPIDMMKINISTRGADGKETVTKAGGYKFDPTTSTMNYYFYFPSSSLSSPAWTNVVMGRVFSNLILSHMIIISKTTSNESKKLNSGYLNGSSIVEKLEKIKDQTFVSVLK